MTTQAATFLDISRGATVLFRMFGVLEVTSASETLKLSADKPRRMLSMLLLRANHWVPDSELIDAVWPTGAPASAPGNIKSYVSQLRHLLGPFDTHPARIERQSGAYRLTVDRAELDTMIFEDRVEQGRAALAAQVWDTAAEMLTEALELWRGTPFESLDVEAARSESARLTELRWSARLGLANALVATGAEDEVVAMLRAMTIEDPLRERIWLRLIEILQGGGRRAEALIEYQHARRAIVDELGIEPCGDLRSLYERLLRDDSPSGSPVVQVTTLDNGEALVSRRQAPWAMAALALVMVLAASVVAALDWPAPRNLGDAITTDPHTRVVTVRRKLPHQLQNPAKLMFGFGDTPRRPAAAKFMEELPARTLTLTYRGQDTVPDLPRWRERIDAANAVGISAHVIVAGPNQHELPIQTRFGPGCGRRYPLTNEFSDEMRRLADAIKGPAEGPALFVTVFDGVNNYGCQDNTYKITEGIRVYYEALQERYLETLQTFHRVAPNAFVALGWDGSQPLKRQPEIGGGRSMFQHFTNVLHTSDFQSVLFPKPVDNPGHVLRSVQALSVYGNVMATYSGSNSANGTDWAPARLFSDANVAELTQMGLFGWNFATDDLPDTSTPRYQLVEDIVNRHSMPPATAAERFNWGDPLERAEFATEIDGGWETGGPWANRGGGQYLPGQVSVANGIATITAKVNGDSGYLRRMPGSLHGRWEARVRMPRGCRCHRPTLALWPDAQERAGEEIVFLEALDATQASARFFVRSPKFAPGINSTPREIDLSVWSTAAVEWTADHVVGYLDGEEWFRTTNTDAVPKSVLHPTIKIDSVSSDQAEPQESTLEIAWVRQYTA
ncbi:MAG: hypothetical protein M3443_03725, partial [Actinomycetota bacterium]|nr:hypothetical protein [Actinomycetota bacterium]